MYFELARLSRYALGSCLLQQKLQEEGRVVVIEESKHPVAIYFAK